MKSFSARVGRIYLDLRTSLLIANTSQESLPDGSTVVPVILGSDKTMLSTLSGNKTAWPVHLSIGNLSEAVRRSVKTNG